MTKMTDIPHQSLHAFLCLYVLSASVQIVASYTVVPLTSEPTLLEADEQEYYHLAGELLRGEYEFNARRTLGHVLVLMILRLVTFDHFIATQLLASAIFALTGPLMYVLVRRMTGNTPLAFLVGVTAICWPPFLYYGNSLYSEITALPCFVALLILIPRGSILVSESEGGWLRWLISGGILGICMLIRPMYLLFAPLAGLILFMEERDWRRSLQRAVLLAAGTGLVVMPWSIFMTANAGMPVVVSANGGETISGGLNPTLIERGYEKVVAPDGRQTWIGPGKWLWIDKSGYLSDEEQELPYAEIDRLLRRRTLNWIVSNPGSAIYLQSAKLLYMWGLYPLELNKQTVLGNVPTIAGLVLSIGALIRFRKYIPHLSRFWILPVFVSGVALVSWGSWRFRQAGDLGILTLSVLCLMSIWIRPSQILNLHPDDSLGTMPDPPRDRIRRS